MSNYVYLNIHLTQCINRQKLGIGNSWKTRLSKKKHSQFLLFIFCGHNKTSKSKYELMLDFIFFLRFFSQIWCLLHSSLHN